MADLQVESFADLDPTDALVIVAFPGAGAAAPIAAQFLVERLDMPLVGHIDGAPFRGVVHVEDGVATSPMRIYGGDVACDIDGPCQRTYVVMTEIPSPMAVYGAAAEAILAWAKDARLILVLDGIARGENDDTPDVFSIAATKEAGKKIAAAKIPPMARATLAGGSAVLLTGARDNGQCAAAFLVEATARHPDGRAAVALVQALNPLIPQIDIDAKPLLADAMRLEDQIHEAMQEAERAQAPMRLPDTFI